MWRNTAGRTDDLLQMQNHFVLFQGVSGGVMAKSQEGLQQEQLISV